MGSRVGALLLSPSGGGPSLGLCGMGSRNDRKMSVRVQASRQKVRRPGSPRKRKDAPGLCKTLFPSCVSARRRRPPTLSALGGAFDLPCPAKQLTAPGACLSQPRGDHRESGIKPCALAPAPSRPQVSAKTRREPAGKGGWGGGSREENSRIKPQLSPGAGPNPRA